MLALGVGVHPQTDRREIARSTALLAIDGKLDDAYWKDVPAHALVPAEAGVPAEIGGNVRVGLRGAHLCLAARLPEPGGKVLARSVGRNPIWEMDAPGSSEVEDRVQYRLQYRRVGGGERNLTLTINPWGAYRIEERGETLPTAGILAAAEVTGEGWSVEAAVPLELLDLDRRAGSPVIRFQAERIRSRRSLAPEFRWNWPGATGGDLVLPVSPSRNAALGAPELRPPPLGNADLPLEVGRVARVPPVAAEWDHPAWEAVPAFELPRNESYSRAPRYPTHVKWLHDGRTLALLVRAVEPEPVVARAGGRDSAVTSDDHVAIYLATSGSALLEIAVNSVGALRDLRVRGPHIMRPEASWNGNIAVQTNIRHGAWVARIDVPLEECAAALGETGIPKQWRVLLSRYRAARPGEADESSTLPVVGASSLYGPLRYRRMGLEDLDPARVNRPGAASQQPPRDGLAAELAALESRVWSPLERRYFAARSMVQRRLRKRAEQAIFEERRAWEAVKTRQDWERFREVRLRALRESVGQFPPPRPPLDVRVTARHEGRGYRLENLVFQSRPGFYVTANLYLPAQAAPRLPGMIIMHSQHYPKTQGELHDMGELWARTGCAVLIVERPGYGERVETTPWYRQAYASRFTFTKQLFLVGESYSGWAAWDVIRSVDLLFERPNIDRERIIVLGSVAGGGEPAALAAALDPRISAVVPFNYDQGHLRVHGDSPGQIIKQFTPWFVAASVAPRRFVRAFEFGWEGAEEPDYPELWVDGLRRSQKVWDFYGVGDNLASSQAYGLIRLSTERVSHCFSIGAQQRVELYPIFLSWFNIPFPSAEDMSILPDSGLSVSPAREEARRQEAQRRRPHAGLLSIPPAVSAQLPRQKLHQIAHAMALELLQAARAGRRGLGAEQRLQRLRDDLRVKLGDIAPPAFPKNQVLWRRFLSGGVEAEAVTVEVEDGITVPLLLLRPAGRQQTAVVVAVAQGGKERFLSDRAKILKNLLRAGVALCLPDVRGTGETSPSSDRSDGGPHHSLAQLEFDMGGSLLGARLKDLRTVLAYLRGRPDLDRRRIAVWGDSFAPPNPSDLFLDELQVEVGPQIQYKAEPLGAHLALLAGLYEERLRAVAAQGGLAGYLTVLEDAFTYTPIDAIVHGLLEVADIADIAAAIAPRPQLLEGLVNGRNIRLNRVELDRALGPTEQAYRERRALERLTIRTEPGDVTAWLLAQIK